MISVCRVSYHMVLGFLLATPAPIIRLPGLFVFTRGNFLYATSLNHEISLTDLWFMSIGI